MEMKRKHLKIYRAAELIFKDRERPSEALNLDEIEKILFWYDLEDMQAVLKE